MLILFLSISPRGMRDMYKSLSTKFIAFLLEVVSLVVIMHYFNGLRIVSSMEHAVDNWLVAAKGS